MLRTCSQGRACDPSRREAIMSKIVRVAVTHGSQTMMEMQSMDNVEPVDAMKVAKHIMTKLLSRLEDQTESAARRAAKNRTRAKKRENGKR